MVTYKGTEAAFSNIESRDLIHFTSQKLTSTYFFQVKCYIERTTLQAAIIVFCFVCLPDSHGI